MIKTLPLNEAEPKLNALVKNAQKGVDDYVLTVNGQPAVRISHLSQEEYESMKETQEILADKGLMKKIKQAEKDIEKGEFLTIEELEKKLGLT